MNRNLIISIRNSWILEAKIQLRLGIILEFKWEKPSFLSLGLFSLLPALKLPLLFWSAQKVKEKDVHITENSWAYMFSHLGVPSLSLCFYLCVLNSQEGIMIGSISIRCFFLVQSEVRNKCIKSCNLKKLAGLPLWVRAEVTGQHYFK